MQSFSSLRAFLRTLTRPFRILTGFMLVLLIIEFLDEVIYGAQEAALPLIQSDLGLSYAEIGLLFSIPAFISTLIEPFIGILGDLPGKRRALVLGGGVVLALGLALFGLAPSLIVLIIVTSINYPASGAFVSLAQASLMDSDPKRHEQNMARWGFAGSLGVIGGSTLVFAITSLDISWRVMMLGLACITGIVVVIAWRYSFTFNGSDEVATVTNDVDNSQVADLEDPPLTFREAVKGAVNALKQREVLRWLLLLEFSDLMLDVLTAYLSLFFVNELGLSVETGALILMVMRVIGMVGDFLVIPLLEIISGITFLRFTAGLQLILFPAFLLVEPIALKLIILSASHFFSAGWYPIIQARLYSALPGRSGTVITVTSIFGMVSSMIPLIIGVIANEFGLVTALWAMLSSPIVILMGLVSVKAKST